MTMKSIHLEKAAPEAFETVLSFYDDVIENTPGIELTARWRKGAHPTEEGLRTLLENGDLYLCRENGSIIGAMAFPMRQGEDYHAVAWKEKLPDDQVATVHILGVRPSCQGTGVASAIIREAISLARSKGMKAVRLDTLASNLPARHIYESLGFEFRGKQHLYAENTGWMDFFFYEFTYLDSPTISIDR